MKKIYKRIVCFTAAAVLSSVAFTACGNGNGSSEPQPDYNNIVISGLEDVFIDKDTETFDIMDGVTATYKYENGKEASLGDELRVVLPEHASVDDGRVTFDACGDYEISYYVNDAKGNNTVAKRSVKVRNIYNCYWMCATLPVLYCALDIVSNDYKSMLTFTRADTLNIDELDDDRFLYKINGASNADLREAWRMTARIAYEDEWSYFRLFMTDVYSQSEVMSMMRYKIPSSRYEVKLVSDGGFTYGSAFSAYRGENTYSAWQANKKIYDAVIDKALRNEFTVVDGDTGNAYIEYGGKKFGTDVADGSLARMGIMAAQRDNVELWCNYPETLVSADPKVMAEVKKAHMPKMSPKDMYANLTDAQKEKFLALCNFDKAEFDEQYFAEEGKYLIITGTNGFTGSLTDAEFADVLSRIIEDYDGYNILYKPHPKALEPTDSMPQTAAVIADNNIKILPGRLPMEIISWVYGDVELGGFDSSLYMAVPQGNTKFFICNGKDALSEISKQLYNDGAFGSPEFYWKAA